MFAQEKKIRYAAVILENPPYLGGVFFTIDYIRPSREIRVAFDYIPPQETKELLIC